MKKKNTGLIAIVGGVIAVVGLLFVLNFLTNKQEEGYLIDDDGKKEEITVDYENVKEEIQVEGLDLTGQSFIGKTEAPVKVVKFGDYKCSHCATWEKMVFKPMKEKYVDNGDVQFYYINFQFMGPDSILAGIAGEAIYNQNPDAFWVFYEKLFEAQRPANEIWATKTFLKKFVKENVEGIDYELFNKELDEEKYLYDVKRDFVMGDKLGITSTPTIVVNGKAIGNTYQDLEKEIESLLKEGK